MPENQIIFEFRTIGASTQVRAIDEASGLEVAVTVPSSASKNQMIQVAKNKLLYIMNKNSN